MGCPIEGDKRGTVELSWEEGNTIDLEYLSHLVGVVESTPNTTIKTFDVYDKRKPNAVAIDARNGKLIRGAALASTKEEAFQEMLVDEQDLFGRWNVYSDDEFFDGTIEEHQRKGRGK